MNAAKNAKSTKHKPLTILRFYLFCSEFLQCVCLLNTRLKHFRSNLVCETPNNFIFRMFYCGLFWQKVLWQSARWQVILNIKVGASGYFSPKWCNWLQLAEKVIKHNDTMIQNNSSMFSVTFTTLDSFFNL